MSGKDALSTALVDELGDLAEEGGCEEVGGEHHERDELAEVHVAVAEDVEEEGVGVEGAGAPVIVEGRGRLALGDQRGRHQHHEVELRLHAPLRQRRRAAL
jgi:hypothetical protein